jgi:hypothetical protein
MPRAIHPANPIRTKQAQGLPVPSRTKELGLRRELQCAFAAAPVSMSHQAAAQDHFFNSKSVTYVVATK